MSGWIKFEKDLLTDPRMLRMARKLCEKGLRYPFDSVTHERYGERDIRYAITLLAGAWAAVWVYADTHVDINDRLHMGVADVDRIAGIEGFCSFCPPDWLLVEDEDSCVKLPDYQKHNGVESRRKDQAALRMQRHRERKRNEVKRTSVTDASPDLDLDLDLDQDKTKKESTSSQARSAPVDSTPVVQTLPLREGGEFAVRQSLVAELEPLYPAVDVPTTLNEMKGWLLLNVERRKTRNGVRRFIGSWLQREQEKHANGR